MPEIDGGANPKTFNSFTPGTGAIAEPQMFGCLPGNEPAASATSDDMGGGEKNKQSSISANALDPDSFINMANRIDDWSSLSSTRNALLGHGKKGN